jgi:hypothetical protein
MEFIATVVVGVSVFCLYRTATLLEKCLAALEKQNAQLDDLHELLRGRL